MRRILLAAVIGFMSLPNVSRGDYPYSAQTGGYVYYSAKCGRTCPYGYGSYGRLSKNGPYGSVPPLGQVWGPTTIVAGRGFCPAGNGWPIDARSHKRTAESVPSVDANAAAKSPWLK